MPMTHSCTFHFSSDELSPVNNLVNCTYDNNCWTSKNFLQLNIDKTEILVVGPKKHSQKIYSHLDLLSLKDSEQVVLDSDLNFEKHISNITNTAFKKIYQNLEHSFLKLTLRNWCMQLSQAG